MTAQPPTTPEGHQPSVCAAVRTSLGAYAMGVLEPEDQARVHAHVAGCAACAEEVAGLRRVVGLLHLVDPDQVGGGPPRPDPALLDALRARVVASRVRRRRRELALTAAGLVLVAGAGAGGALVDRAAAPRVAVAGPAGVSRSISGSDPHTGVGLWVGLRTVAWGTSVSLRLYGISAGEQCRLVALGPGGRAETAATWTVPASGYAGSSIAVTGALGLPAAQISRVSVVTVDGRVLVSVPVPPRAATS
ncbi:MAG: zf-HC2 domain-containing protein [Actinomycetes bacterium]